MRISFDLDDTLICYHPGSLYEPRLRWYWRLVVNEEPLRLGMRELGRELMRRGHELWVYTTSFRSPFGVAWWLRGHGIRVRRVVNQDVHDRELRRLGHRHGPSKNPSMFGIDLHIDDSAGVGLEGREHGFRVVVVDPLDGDWARRVLAAAGR